MRCAKCGDALEAGARFCGECGTPVAIATIHPVSPPPAIATDPAQQWVVPFPVVTKSPATATPASRRGLFLGIGAAIVAGGAGVVYWRTRSRRLVVDASGSGDYPTIASAILGARPQDTIVLRPGTYKESLTVRSDVQIVGEGGRSMVFVEGAPGANVFEFEGGRATLTGMTIRVVGTVRADQGTGAILVRSATPVFEDCDLTSSAGAAVYIRGPGANPVIRNCTMRNSSGSGVVVFYQQGQGTIEKCLISGNARSGVEIRTGGNPTVRDCEIRDNNSSGVSVIDQGQGTIEKCLISGNALSGVQISEGGNPTARNCEIRDGKGAGVYVYEEGHGTFTGNTLTGNARGAWVIDSTAGKMVRTGNTPNE